LDNTSAFSNAFFQGIPQRTAPAPLELREGISKNMKTLTKSTQKSAMPSLVLGEGETAEKLKSLKIEEQAFQFRCTPTMSACFDLPYGKVG
jgi:hypothetical protein